MPVKPARPARVSRRGFVKGAGALGALGALAPALSGCGQEDAPVGSHPLVVDEESGTSVMDSFSYVDTVSSLSQTAEWSLPSGTTLFPAEGNWLPAFTPATLATTLVGANLFSLASGSMVPLFASPVSSGNNMSIYTLAASDSLVAWVEIDMVSKAWTLFARAFSNGVLGEGPVTLAQHDVSYLPPTPAVTGTSVVWQVMPAGTKSKESSKAYVYTLGGSAEGKLLIESPGKFATAPYASQGQVTLTPRAEGTQAVYYALANYNLSSFASAEQLMLPQGVKPFSAIWANHTFVFQVQATYSGVGLLGKMGTFIAQQNDQFLYVGRAPYASPAYVKGSYVLKNQASYVVVDEANTTYSVLSAANRCTSWGEYPLRIGDASDFVTFATVKSLDAGVANTVCVRRFA